MQCMMMMLLRTTTATGNDFRFVRLTKGRSIGMLLLLPPLLRNDSFARKKYWNAIDDAVAIPLPSTPVPSPPPEEMPPRSYPHHFLFFFQDCLIWINQSLVVHGVSTNALAPSSAAFVSHHQPRCLIRMRVGPLDHSFSCCVESNDHAIAIDAVSSSNLR